MVPSLVRARYVVPQLWVGLDLVGASFEIERAGRRVRVSLPGTVEEFSALPGSISERWMPSLVEAGPVFNEPGRDGRTAAVMIFEVSVEGETDVSSPKPSALTPELRDVVEGDLRVGLASTDQVAHAVTRHFRAAAPRQTWLGLAAHRPQQYGIAVLENRETGEFLFGIGAEQRVVMRSSRLRLELTDLEGIAKDVEAEVGPSLADSLLADAFHLFDADAFNDRDRAWVVAATACEVRAKEALRAAVLPERAEELNEVLRRRSNVTDLLDTVWKEFLGVTLRKDDPDLFAKAKVLTGQRNRLVHAGRHVDAVPLTMDPALTAHKLFEWMSSHRT